MEKGLLLGCLVVGILLNLQVAICITCLKCNGVSSLKDCFSAQESIQKCQPDEACYMEKKINLETGTHQYYAGCRQLKLCVLDQCQKVAFGDGRSRAFADLLNVPVCTECCYESNCNIELCGAILNEIPSNITQCFNCKGIHDDSICSHTIDCDLTLQRCLVQIKLGNIELSCINARQCGMLLQLPDVEKETRCCDKYLCNGNPYIPKLDKGSVLTNFTCPANLTRPTTAKITNTTQAPQTPNPQTTILATPTSSSATPVATSNSSPPSATLTTSKSTNAGTHSSTPESKTLLTTISSSSTSEPTTTAIQQTSSTTTNTPSKTQLIQTDTPITTTTHPTTTKSNTSQTTTPTNIPTTPALATNATFTASPSQTNATSTESPPQTDSTSTESSPQTDATSTESSPQTSATSTESSPQTSATSTESSPQTSATSTESSPQTNAISTESAPQTKATSTESPPQTNAISTESSPQTKATSTESPPQTTEPTIPTIATTPTTTALEIVASTAPPPKTLAPDVTTSCAVCAGPAFLCEKLFAPTPCPAPENYCINTVINHKDGTRDVERKCGDFDTCYREWFQGSSDDDKCRQFDENNEQRLDFQCTYCCITDDCNIPLRPDGASLYKPA